MASQEKRVDVNITTHKRKTGNGQFTIPIRYCRQIGVGPGDMVWLVIKTPDGAHLFSGEKKLSSGTEIYGPDISAVLEPGQPIRVTMSRQ